MIMAAKKLHPNTVAKNNKKTPETKKTPEAKTPEVKKPAEWDVASGKPATEETPADRDARRNRKYPTAQWVALSTIEANHKWNSRSGQWKDSKGGPDEKSGFMGIVESIREKGQDEPVVLRPQANKEKPNFLVAGYRRFEAVSHIAKEEKDPEPKIWAVIEEMTDAEARARNIRENTIREDVKTPDIAWSVWELLKLGGTDKSVSKVVGHSQVYVNVLHRIMERVDPKITKAWRESPIQIPVNDMKALSEIPIEKQDEAFKRILGGLAAGKKKPNVSKINWLETLRRKAYDVGYIFGSMTREGVLDASKVHFSKCVDLIVTTPKQCTPKHRESIADAAEEGYAAAIEEEEEDDEE
jgi:ParB/RepB/Spo0J family partition protein